MEDITEIIKWYILSGVDEICDNTAHCSLSLPPQIVSEKAKTPKTTAYYQEAECPEDEPQIRPATTLLAQTNNQACENAKELCKKAQTLDDLKAMLESFNGCALKFSATSLVFGYGNPQAEIMIIGEAPGADEDRIGEPFVGKSGHLLDKMLSSISVNREDCYIANVLPWRPPGNRTPTDGEIAVCLPFLKRQIELVKPRIIFLLGGSAANSVLDNTDGISHLRGHFIDYTTDNGLVIPTLSSFHPAFLLRNSLQKSKAWSDLLRLKRKLQEL